MILYSGVDLPGNPFRKGVAFPKRQIQHSGVEQPGVLVGLITRRSEVQILAPLKLITEKFQSKIQELIPEQSEATQEVRSLFYSACR